ncbi:MAG: hypothetical protein ACLFWI_18845 [Coleofasciculus sp.]
MQRLYTLGWGLKLLPTLTTYSTSPILISKGFNHLQPRLIIKIV